MTQKHLIECNGCGKEALATETGGWLEVRTRVVKVGESVNFPVIYGDVCSANCLTLFAHKAQAGDSSVIEDEKKVNELLQVPPGLEELKPGQPGQYL